MTAKDLEGTVGLSEVSSDDLQQFADALASGVLRPPLSTTQLGFAGFTPLIAALEPYFELDQKALLAILDAVLAERRKLRSQQIELVWSGSDSGPSHARYTRVVIPELIQSAKRQITIAGYSFDSGAGIFQELHSVMQERRVAVRFFLDVHQLHQRLKQQLISQKLFSRLAPVDAANRESPTAFAAEVLRLFRELHWPFEGAAPELYYDPRTADARSFASLHAKCVIVDYEQVLVTSANFTGRGQTRNIEVGILVRDKGYAAALEQQWNNLIDSNDVVRG